MTKLMDEAIASLLHDVPPTHQDDIARMVMRLTGKTHPIYHLTSEERADLDEADAEIARGDFATEEQVRAVWAKYDL